MYNFAPPARGAPNILMPRHVDALTSPTLKHLRERWWDSDFSEFLRETLRPRPGTRILDVGLRRRHGRVEPRAAADLAGLAVRDRPQDRAGAPDARGRHLPQHQAEGRRRRRARVAVCRRRLRLHLLRGRAPAFARRRPRRLGVRARDQAGRTRRGRGTRQRRALLVQLEPGRPARLRRGIAPLRRDRAGPPRRDRSLGRPQAARHLRQGRPRAAVGEPLPGVGDAHGPAARDRLAGPPREPRGRSSTERPTPRSARSATEYTAALDAYEKDAGAAGPGFVEIQNTMLFATVGQKAE